MGLGLGYKVDVAAIPIEILSKFPLSPLQNVLEYCHDGEGIRFNSTDEAKHQQKHSLEISLQNFSKMV